MRNSIGSFPQMQKVHQRYCPFPGLERKKSGSEVADRPLRSPISLYFARFSPKMQEKTSFVVVDKRGFFDGRGSKTRTLACGLAQSSALRPHRGLIHSRTQFESLHYDTKKEPARLGGFLFGRGSKTRTHKNGFGDRYVTITSCPCIGNVESIAHRRRVCQTNCERL